MLHLDNYFDKRESLYDKYPRLLKNCYIDVQEGWFPIVDRLCTKIENAYQKLSSEEKEKADEEGYYQAAQIKEKYGGLRFYICPETREISKWIREAEAACDSLCEYCGAVGSLRKGGWLKTLCDSCELHRIINRWRQAKDIDVGLLKDNHVRLYYFGLGFIQLKVDDRLRLHFYSPELPTITEDVHNHRYDFDARILKGKITNFTFDILEGETHQINNESCNPDIEAPSETKLCNITLADQETYTTGQVYKMKHQDFHRVEATDCITLLSRSSYKKEFAQVITPVGKKSVCPFSKQIPEDKLWSIIEDMVKN